MSEVETNGHGQKARKGRLAKAGLGFTIAGPVLMLLGALAAKFELVHYQIGLLALLAGVVLVVVGALIGLIALLILLLRKGGRRGLVPALVSVAGGLAVGAAFVQVSASLPKNPGIHDVATDWATPIMFSADTMALRGPDSNPVEPSPRVGNNKLLGELAGKSIAEINARTCDAAKPLILAVTPAEAFAKAKAAADKTGMAVHHEDPAAGVLEVTDSTFWFGFEDDVAFRIRPDGAGSRVDLRSISRVGGGDLGANCKRIARLKAAMAG